MSEGKQLIYALAGWVAYFLLIYFSCVFLYLKIRGKPPADPDRRILHGGKHRPAGEVWAMRDRRLRRYFSILGAVLVFLPLLFPVLVRILF